MRANKVNDKEINNIVGVHGVNPVSCSTFQT